MVAGPTYIRRCCALRSVSAFSVVRPRPYSAILQPGADLPWQTTCTWLFFLISYAIQDHWRLWLPNISLSIVHAIFRGLLILQSRRCGSMQQRPAPAARHVQGAAVVHCSDARPKWPRGQIINYWPGHWTQSSYAGWQDHHDGTAGQHQFYSTMVAGVLVSDCWRCVLLYSLLRRLTTFSPHNTVAKMKHSIPRCLTTWGVDIPI